MSRLADLLSQVEGFASELSSTIRLPKGERVIAFQARADRAIKEILEEASTRILWGTLLDVLAAALLATALWPLGWIRAAAAATAVLVLGTGARRSVRTLTGAAIGMLDLAQSKQDFFFLDQMEQHIDSIEHRVGHV